MENLKQFGIVPIDSGVLESLMTSYKKPLHRVARLAKEGLLIRLKRSLYVVSQSVSGKVLSTELIANHIYGPSYVSMESAMRYYGLIPESVHLTRSMTIKRSRNFETPIGGFAYTQCSDEYFSIGVQQAEAAGATYLMASPEKALCDMICYTPALRLRSVKAMVAYLEDDLRFDMERLMAFDVNILKACSEVSKKKEDINNLIKIIEL